MDFEYVLKDDKSNSAKKQYLSPTSYDKLNFVLHTLLPHGFSKLILKAPVKLRASTEAWREHLAPKRRLHIAALPAGEEVRHC